MADGEGVPVTQVRKNQEIMTKTCLWEWKRRKFFERFIKWIYFEHLGTLSSETLRTW